MFIPIEDIIKALEGNLPGSISHRKMLPTKRNLTVAHEDKNRVKKSSVLLLLFVKNKQLMACLIKRPLHMKYHAGQIALPGGKIEKNETTLETALRETFEEIGIPKQKIKILGSLSELYVDVSQFLIKPYVGWLEKEPEFKLNKDEVEKLLLFPLLNHKNSMEETAIKTVTGKLMVPCIKFEDEIIWGATAMILSEFYDILEQI